MGTRPEGVPRLQDDGIPRFIQPGGPDPGVRDPARTMEGTPSVPPTRSDGLHAHLHPDGQSRRWCIRLRGDREPRLGLLEPRGADLDQNRLGLGAPHLRHRDPVAQEGRISHR